MQNRLIEAIKVLIEEGCIYYQFNVTLSEPKEIELSGDVRLILSGEEKNELNQFHKQLIIRRQQIKNVSGIELTGMKEIRNFFESGHIELHNIKNQ